MEAALKKHIDSHLPFLTDKKLLLAVSGGIDSAVLTHLFFQLKFSISIAHCNFLLRGKESNKDEIFVKNLGDKLMVPTFTKQFETKQYAAKKGISTQMAARNLRYQWFQEITNTHQLDYILTAHQKDDVIETFLINLTRGTGIDGLTGIPEINENIVRPLLQFSRNDILIYATKNKLAWREDSSNTSIKYVRNKIRHKVVPVLKELNPNLLDTFNNTISHLKGSQQIIEDRIQRVQKKIITKNNKEWQFNISRLRKLNNPKIYLYEFLKVYNFTEWQDIEDLMNAQTGKQVFSQSHRLLKDRDVLVLSKLKKAKEDKSFQLTENTSQINKPITLNLEKIAASIYHDTNQSPFIDQLKLDKSDTISVDYNKITFPLTLRKWQKGDYFYPIGLNGRKKISKYFKDEKLSMIEKENVWLLCSQNDIIWVVGKRMDERFKVTKSTSIILIIKNLI